MCDCLDTGESRIAALERAVHSQNIAALIRRIGDLERLAADNAAPAAAKVVELAVGVLKAKAGDMVVVTVPQEWTVWQVKEFGEWVNAILDQQIPGIKALMLPAGADVRIITDPVILGIDFGTEPSKSVVVRHGDHAFVPRKFGEHG